MKTLTTLLLLLVSLAPPCRADLISKAASETAEFVLKKFGKKAVTEGGEALASKLASSAARHGDDVLSAVRKVGPQGHWPGRRRGQERTEGHAVRDPVWG